MTSFPPSWNAFLIVFTYHQYLKLASGSDRSAIKFLRHLNVLSLSMKESEAFEQLDAFPIVKDDLCDFQEIVILVSNMSDPDIHKAISKSHQECKMDNLIPGHSFI